METIQLKDQVIIKQGTDMHIFQMNAKTRFQGIELDAIGFPFWSTFKKDFTQGKPTHFVHCDPSELFNDPKVDLSKCGADNRNIQNTNNAQALTQSEIRSMKDEGVSSQDILTKLIENSTTFSHKTEFSQEKYLRKKTRKHTDYIQILKPNLRLVCEILLKKNSGQMLGMRMDTLSQIVTYLNVHASGTYLIYENNCQGLVLASVLNLLNEKGKLINIVTPKYPFDKLNALKILQQNKTDNFINVSVDSFLKYSNINTDTASTNNCSLSEPTLIEGTNKRSLTDDRIENKKNSFQNSQDCSVRDLLSKKADGLVIVCKQVPNELAKQMLQFLAPSRNFVVYCQYQEPLVKLYQDLKSNSNVVYVRIFENWFRGYQVLPDRTHPEITMNAAGGYILTGTTVCSDQECEN